MIRQRLLGWQWSDYAAKHQNRLNLLLHIVTVPFFLVGTLILLCAAITVSVAAAVVGVICMVGALAAQGRGHRLEPETPVPGPRAVDCRAKSSTHRTSCGDAMGTLEPSAAAGRP